MYKKNCLKDVCMWYMEKSVSFRLAAESEVRDETRRIEVDGLLSLSLALTLYVGFAYVLHVYMYTF